MYSTVAKPWLNWRAASSLRNSASGIGSPVSVMDRKAAQDLRPLQPMFVELRGKFDEIAGDIGARDIG